MYEHDVCDFCSNPHPVRIFNAPDFAMVKDEPLPMESKSGWMACQLCGEFIDAGKWDALRLRAVAALLPKYFKLGMSRADLVAQVDKSHLLFRQHMRRDA
jgi:hypothetical protein